MTDTQNTTAPASLVPEIRPEVWADLEQRYRKLEDTVCHYNPSANFQQIRAAFEFAAKAHGPQMRKDGSPFITHPLAVAQIVAEELHLDSESIEAALLHDTIEDTSATHEDISRLFSPTVADLVEGVSKLTRVHYTSKEEEQMENLRKMLMAMSKDIRVILIKISDRLHNMRTMEYQTPEKQKQKSFETMEIYAPIAHRLGMQKMKWELEDLSLKYLDPISYREIVEALNEKAAQYDGFMSSIHDQITRRLREAHIDGYVYGRMKHPYSIYRKMYTQNKSLDDVYDLFAFRVIVDTVSDCYNVLGIIHDLYKPILGRFKDYIGTPKPNMYQSLHTTVVGQNGIPFEVQIRTREMHEVAEYGIAAHWKYKQNGQGAGDEGRYEWVRRLLENQEGADAEDFIHSLKVDMFADEVFVFTPRGDVINLPAGATPIDFAYNIHSAVGNHMVGAKVNGRLVPFDTRLKNGDIVEVVTSQSAHGPSRDWVKIARSSNARSKIRQWFKRERRDENIVNGRSSFESELRRCGVTLKELTAEENLPGILKKLSFKSLDDMYAAIGYGGVTSLKLIGRLREDIQRILHQHQAERQAEVPVEGQPEVTRRLHEEGVKVVYDSGWSDDLSIDGIKAFLPYIDVYTPNDKEARKLAGTDDLEEAVRFLAGYTPHPVVTLGKGGCAYWHDGSIRYVSAIDEFRAVDTTGAGDNFLTGIIYGLLTEEPLDRCVRLGNIFAGKSTTAVGCFGAAVTPALIRKYL